MFTWLFGVYWAVVEVLRGSYLWSNGGLFNTAQRRAEELATQDVLSHDGFWAVTWPADCSAGYYGEVIGKSNGGEQLIFDAWLASPGHVAVLLDSVYNAIGYGLARVGDMLYMVIHTALCW